MIKYDLFPTAVGCFDSNSNLTVDELDFIKNQEFMENQGNTTSVDNYIFNNTKLSRILDFCNKSLFEYVNSIYYIKDEIKPYITQSWANYTNIGGFHHRHTHSNSIISGVFYVQVNDNVDNICFMKSGYDQIKLPVKNWNIYNSKSWCIPIKTGQLILFPSSLEHSVPKIEIDKTRISISFNTFVKGVIGNNTELTELYL
jgi:uncharacterized protein (TIGR02466 family)